MVMDYQIELTPNARLLYQESFSFPLDWHYHIALVDQFVSESPQILKANPYQFIYFFSSPVDENFGLSNCWIGKEIVGYIDTSKNEEFEIYDLNSSYVFSYDLVKAGKLPLASDLMNKYMEMEKILSGFGKKLAPTWRIKIEPIT